MEKERITAATRVNEEKQNRKVYVPKVDIYETGDGMVLLVDMPGVDEKTVDVTLNRNVLTIQGRAEAEKFEGYSLAYTEYGTGDYQRAFTISDEIDRDKIEAVVKNGVLKITLHKAEQAKARKIAITAG
ncbi:MAG TPA: Hsp20/alpha crystallin family protein [Syntrophales bacterium]|nr:Hsp20/alpha crystallin family protein [Syntrophales bacterium]HOL59623.1 Hsp20/alpha crystallin family protein [Syntrophales bacterium]HPO35769.1 Hsp20/alpha crystallin family protein [Syntrophales bacterium]